MIPVGELGKQTDREEDERSERGCTANILLGPGLKGAAEFSATVSLIVGWNAYTSEPGEAVSGRP